MNNQLMQIPQEILKQIKCLRKISPTDKFPCFNCFDDKIEKINCRVCAGSGFVYGSHPMVQFSEDFIQKKISFLKRQQQAKKKQLAIQSQQLKNQKSDKKNNIKNVSLNIEQEKQDNMGSHNNFSLVKSKILSDVSSDQEDEQIRHNGFCCDDCEEDPIIGYRYHCETCQDFDLCPKCYRKGNHNHEFLIFKQPQGINRASNVSKHQMVVKNIRKSMRKIES